MADDKKPSILQKIAEVGSTMLDAQIAKARNEIAANSQLLKSKAEYDESSFEWGKAVTKDRTFYQGSQGYEEKAGGLSYEYQKQMAIKSSIVAAIIKTYSNRVATHSEYVPHGSKPGFKIVLKYEQDELERVKEEMFGDQEAQDQLMEGNADAPDAMPGEVDDTMAKAGEVIDTSDLEGMTDPASQPPVEEPMTEADMVREARKQLDMETRKKKKEIAEFILNCGEVEDRPFETKKWAFNTFLRAIVWDSLVYDQIAVEIIPKEAAKMDGKLRMHHFQPIDGATIRYASDQLGRYKDVDLQMAQDILFPEEELKGLEERDALELDEGRLERNEYKYVQVIRGRMQRAFTEAELKVGMRNPITDVYSNGYSISELELLVALVTSHLQTEFYNRSYFQQGFSAKGILHVKANLNRSKLEELRRNWNHMVKGNRNSFQTPIMAGMDEVQWIPLTQSHSDMEFTMWLNYLIRMICSIYQIDPSEIGYGMKDEGRGGGISGDNTKEKLDNSKSKGFVPLMKFIQDFINKNVVDTIDPKFKMEWVGLEDETDMSRIARQKEEVQWKKTLNEIRAEDGLPPIKGADSLVMNPVFFQWYSTMSEEGKANQQEMASQAMGAGGGAGGPPGEGMVGVGGENNEGSQKNWEADQAAAENDHSRAMEAKASDQKHDKSMASKVKKSLGIEFFKLGGE